MSQFAVNGPHSVFPARFIHLAGVLFKATRTEQFPYYLYFAEKPTCRCLAQYILVGSMLDSSSSFSLK